MRLICRSLIGCVCVLSCLAVARALVAPEAGRFTHLVIPDPTATAGIAAEAPRDIPGFDAEAALWEAFGKSHGGGWRVLLDRRSGTPLLVEGPGISWFDADGPAPTLADLEARALAFLVEHRALFTVDPAQLVLSQGASGALDRDHRLLVFERKVDGIPVEGHRFLFWITRGRLASFGATRWGALTRKPEVVYTAEAAREVLRAYMGLVPGDLVTELDKGTEVLVTAPVEPASAGPYAGAAGRGSTFRLAYRFALRVEGDPGTWVGKVDATTGEVVAFYDDNRYTQTRGGVYPVSDDGLCPDGCEQAGYPMPYADVSVNASPGTSGDMGLFACAPSGGSATTTLAGPYIRVHDNCGAISESAVCSTDLDLKTGPGTDCQVPQGASPGDTHASRSSFYHLNRVMEKGRAWLPTNTWLQSQLLDNVNINSVCNAFWDGNVNFYKSGGGCRNTGEIAGVFVHEWGHGLDANDGGGYDNPSEAYADVVALFQTHVSCVGRGFYVSGNCGGYGDACLNCSGIRDQDWNMHQSHTPATPSGFGQNNCAGGGGPCGKEEHCEGYIAAETIWDLAVRDLPAMGLDPATGWQVADRLFYKSRQGSGGNAYNCALPSSDGCNAGSWFNSTRNVDDDDGNLANGTPHAGAIFAAFARHGIACGAASDPSNQSFAACTPPASPALAATPDDGAIHLSWAAVVGATRYHVLRNDLGCAAGHTVVATVEAPATSYTDLDLPNAFNVYYAVQAEGASASCLSALSSCQALAALPRKGDVRLDQSNYGCSSTVSIEVMDLDLNLEPTTVETTTVTVSSTTESTPETVTLTETGPNTSQFTGSIATSGGPVVSGDGLLQAKDGDLLTATYQDADDGTGVGAVSFETAVADCAAPGGSSVRVTDLTDDSAIVRWTTSEPATSRVDWGSTPALGSVVTDGALVTSHALTVSPLTECGRFYFRVTSTDVYGNTRVYDASGAPFEFNAYRIPGLFSDNFETSTGWTLEGEWQIGSPLGLGSSPPDPSMAFAGTKVLGHDLTGLGAHPGDYEPQTTQSATSPVINASALTQGQLKFRRWLNVGGGGISYVEALKNGTWSTVWNSDSVNGNTETSWSLQTLNIAQYADGNAQLQIRFRQKGGINASANRSGWNVDRFLIKSATQPDFAACGACGGAPSFAGASSAADVNGCADTGVRVDWQPAASWGTGTTGTYSVFRDTTPGFTPSASNRIATGVVGTSYTDASAPNGVTLYYIVRAENDETCSTGPNNGGLVDGNLVRVSARDDTSQSLPGSVGATLQAANVNDAHVRLTWSAVSGAAAYRVYRADAPQGAFSPIAEVSATLYEDPNELGTGVNRFYAVKALDSCGNEGP